MAPADRQILTSLSTTWRTAPEGGHHIGLAKVMDLLRDLLVVRWKLWVVLAAFGFCLEVPKLGPYRSWFLIVWIAVVFWFSRGPMGGAGATDFVLFLSLGAVVAGWREPRTWLLLLPLFVAGGCMAWASNNGVSAASTTLGLGLCLYAAAAIESKPRLSHWLAALLIFSSLMRYQRGAHSEDSIQNLHTRLEGGPFKGLITTPEKAAYLAELEAILAKHRSSAKGILFYPHFPAGYLLTDLLPRSPILWATPTPVLAECLKYYDTNARAGDLVVRVNRLIYVAGDYHDWKIGTHPFDARLAQHDRLVESENFSVYRKR